MQKLAIHQRTLLWGVLLVLALGIRLILIPRFSGFVPDLEVYGRWAQTLTKSDLKFFYRFAQSPDHLPGDLHIHHLIAEGFKAVSKKNFFSPEYHFVLKAVPAVFDILLAVLVYLFVKPRTRVQTATLASLVIAFNPGLIFLSAVWGQWDSVSATIFLAGLILLWHRPSHPLLAAMLFGWALLIKPPLLFLVLPAIAGYAVQHYRRDAVSLSRIAVDLAGTVIVAAITVTVLMWPFAMSWLPGWKTYSLLDQLKMAANLYPNATMGAANLWMIPQGAPFWVDDATTFLHVPYHTWGLVLFGCAFAFIIWRIWHENLTDIWLIWAMAALPYAYFLLPTRSHERYLFPAILMLVILAATSRWQRIPTILMAAASLTYLVNLQIIYQEPQEPWKLIIFEATSILNIIIFLVLLFIPVAQLRATTPAPVAEAQTAPELHPAE